MPVLTYLLLPLVMLATSTSVRADAQLARAKGCVSCHAPERKLVGPPYKAIAARYANDPSAAQRLADKVRQGGVGVWGQIPMAAHPQVSETEALAVVKWILEHK